ncbi:unnamed protein product [Arabidopsis halleri]
MEAKGVQDKGMKLYICIQFYTIIKVTSTKTRINKSGVTKSSSSGCSLAISNNKLGITKRSLSFNGPQDLATRGINLILSELYIRSISWRSMKQTITTTSSNHIFFITHFSLILLFQLMAEEIGLVEVGIATSKRVFQQQVVNYERRKLIANNHTCTYVEYFLEGIYIF